jgi:FkbH-like protein
VAVDLDNTLYHGVMGEDGISGVTLTAHHASLQRTLLRLRESGVFLAIVSRNDEADVRSLFISRGDFPLSLDHFSARAVSWQSKVDGIRAVAKQLRIAPAAMLFVDDNPGELAAVAGVMPELRCLHAGNPEEMAYALTVFPGLHGYKVDENDALRVADLAAVSIREELAQRADDPNEYLRSLAVHLDFLLDDARAVPRLHELSIKTNQFNSGLLRLSENEVARRLADPTYGTVAVSLRDRLSDSGMIAALFARHTDDRIVVEELSISCRALGRSLEDIIVMEALLGLTAGRHVQEVVFNLKHGPRNQPSRDWLARFAASGTASETGYLMPWDAQEAARRLRALPVTIKWGHTS